MSNEYEIVFLCVILLFVLYFGPFGYLNIHGDVRDYYI